MQEESDSSSDEEMVDTREFEEVIIIGVEPEVSLLVCSYGRQKLSRIQSLRPMFLQTT